MIRAGDLSRFGHLPASDLAIFEEKQPHNVRVTFNAPQRTAVYLIPDWLGEEKPEPRFLAVVDGLEDVEFYVHGPYSISVDADVWLHTLDGTKLHIVIPDAETYTRIAERRVIDPNLAHMQRLVLQQRMEFATAMEQMRNDIHASYRERDNLGTGVDGGNSPSSEPAAGTGNAASQPSAAASGTEGGQGDA